MKDVPGIRSRKCRAPEMRTHLTVGGQKGEVERIKGKVLGTEIGESHRCKSRYCRVAFGKDLYFSFKEMRRHFKIRTNTFNDHSGCIMRLDYKGPGRRRKTS